VKKSAIRNRWKRGLSIRRPSPPGSSPGTIVVDPDAPPPSIQVIAYGEGDSCKHWQRCSRSTHSNWKTL
jgi:hypothetical protein